MAQSFVQLPPDGTGKQLHTFKNIDGSHNQVFTQGDPNTPSNLQYVDQYGSAYIRFAEGNQIFDSFGKNKMSQETMVGEYMPKYDSLPTSVQTEVTGGGTELYLPDEASVRFQTGTIDGDRVVRTTNKYHKYYPGTSQLAEFTVTLGDMGKANVIRQWGYYDDRNGIIFKVNGTAFEIVLRSDSTGSVVETVIPQADFNVDKGDGTGISGLFMNPSYTNIYWLDLQYLGAGRVRIGAYSPNGQRVVFHQVENSNNQPSVYMGTASLPLRWEQFNQGIAASTSEMKVHNAAVYTETANLNTDGPCFSTAAWGALPVPKTSVADGTFCSMVAIRPKALFNGKANRNIIIPQYLLVNTDKPLQISVYENVDNGANTWVSVHDQSIVEKSGDVVFTDLGTDTSVFCTMAPAGTTRFDMTSSFSYFKENLHNLADGTQPTYTVIFRALDGTAAVAGGGLTWQEIIV